MLLFSLPYCTCSTKYNCCCNPSVCWASGYLVRKCHLLSWLNLFWLFSVHSQCLRNRLRKRCLREHLSSDISGCDFVLTCSESVLFYARGGLVGKDLFSNKVMRQIGRLTPTVIGGAGSGVMYCHYAVNISGNSACVCPHQFGGQVVAQKSMYT